MSPMPYCSLVAPVVRITWWYFGDRLSSINARITCLKSHFRLGNRPLACTETETAGTHVSVRFNEAS